MSNKLQGKFQDLQVNVLHAWDSILAIWFARPKRELMTHSYLRHSLTYMHCYRISRIYMQGPSQACSGTNSMWVLHTLFFLLTSAWNRIVSWVHSSSLLSRQEELCKICMLRYYLLCLAFKCSQGLFIAKMLKINLYTMTLDTLYSLLLKLPSSFTHLVSTHILSIPASQLSFLFPLIFTGLDKETRVLPIS